MPKTGVALLACGRAAVMRRASCGLKCQAGIECEAHLPGQRVCAHCLWGGDGARKLDARARCAALVVVGPRSTDGRCANQRHFTFGARPWCDVPAVASNTKPGASCHAQGSRRSLAL